MKPQAFVLAPKDYAAALHVLGVEVTVLASNSATQSYEITLQKGGEGIGPPPHSHGWDESFFIIKGSVEFSCAGKTSLCMPGTLVHIPAGTVHSFHFAGEGGEMLEFTGQGGSASQMFVAMDQEIAPGPPDLSKVVEVLAQYGVKLAP